MSPQVDLAGPFALMLLLIGLVLGGFLLTFWLRRWLRTEAPVEQLTLQDLRDLRARGELSEEEFQRLRETLLGRFERTGGAASDEPPRGRG